MIILSTESSQRSMSHPPILMSMVQASPAGEPNGTAAFLFQIFPFVIVFAIFYLLWIRPQQRQVKALRESIAAVKKGDDVITGGGIRGRVTKVSDDEAEVEIAQGVRIRVVKSTISQVLTPNAKPAND
jgi:preprotein translocase subunit YajC